MPEKKITPTHYETLIKIFELDGFIIKRKKGDHIIMTKPGVKRPLVIKDQPKARSCYTYQNKYGNCRYNEGTFL